VAELVRAGAGEDKCGDDRAAVVGAPVRGTLHLGAGVEQADDLFGGVEVHGPAGRELEPAASPGGRVGGQVAVLDGDGEDRLQDLDRLVDRVWGEGSQDAAVVVAQGLAAFDRAAAQVGLLDFVAAVLKPSGGAKGSPLSGSEPHAPTAPPPEHKWNVS
jgi:hypothetical protein